MRTYVFAVLIFALILTTPGFAFIFTVPEETIMAPAGTTKDIDIRFGSAKADDIAFTVLDTKPWISQSDTIVRIPAEGTQYVKLFISPFADTPTVVYKLTLQAESRVTGEEQKKFIFISVSKIEILEIQKIDISGNFTPTGQVNVTVVLKNYKPRTIEGIKVVSSVFTPSSKLLEFEQNVESIDSGFTHNITYSFTIPKQSESGVYSVAVKATAENESSDKTRTFSVASQAKFTQESSKQPLLMGFSKAITVTNIGNTKDDAFVTDTLSPFEAAFFSGEKPTTTRGGDFIWLVKDIGSGESRTIQYKVDFTPLFLFILVLIVAAWIFFFKIRTLKIKKYILEKKFIEEGEEFTVGVEVMNSTGRKIENATIKDFIPSVFDVKEGEGPKPVRKKTAAGTELVWKIKDLHKNEERILSYKILPVFGVHGIIRLPQASVSFPRGKKEAEIRSGFANIGVETENYGEKRLFRKHKK